MSNRGRRKSNALFGWLTKKRTTSVHRHGGRNARDVERDAYAAGKRAGDSDTFSSWVSRQGDWGPESRKRFRQAFNKGVEQGSRPHAESGASIPKRKSASPSLSSLSTLRHDVATALINQGVSKEDAIAAALRATGQSFEMMFRSVTLRNPSRNPIAILTSDAFRRATNPATRAALLTIGMRTADALRRGRSA